MPFDVLAHRRIASGKRIGAGEIERAFDLERHPRIETVPAHLALLMLDAWSLDEDERPFLRRLHAATRYSSSLLDAGVKLQTARSAIEYLKEDLGDDWASASLVLNGSTSVLARTGDDLVDLVRRGQGVLNIVPLGHVVDELDTKIVEMHPDLQRDAAGNRTGTAVDTAASGS